MSDRDQAEEMESLLVLCPTCKAAMYVMAEAGSPAPRVKLPFHERPDGEHCTSSEKSFYLGPPGKPPEDEDLPGEDKVFYSVAGEHFPLPIPSSAPLLSRIEAYAKACPLSTLIKLYLRVWKASETTFDLLSLFYDENMEAMDADPLYSPLEAVWEILKEEVRYRFSTSLEANSLDEDYLVFTDSVSGESMRLRLEGVVPSRKQYSPESPDRARMLGMAVLPDDEGGETEGTEGADKE